MSRSPDDPVTPGAEEAPSPAKLKPSWKRGQRVFVWDGAAHRGDAKVRAVLPGNELLLEMVQSSCGRCSNNLAIVPTRFVR